MKLLCKLVGHKYGQWQYVAEDSCEQVRICQRDGHKEPRGAIHQFSTWKYVKEDSCQQVRTCSHCHREGEGQLVHQFSPWKYAKEDSCQQVRTCSHCHREEEQVVHQWMSWQSVDGEQHKRACVRDRLQEVEHHTIVREEYEVCTGSQYQGGAKWDCYATKIRCSCAKCGYSDEWVTGEGWSQDYSYQDNTP